MPTQTHTPLASITLSGNDPSVTISSIPQNYRDLVLICATASDDQFRQYRIRINGDTGNNYYGISIYQGGSSQGSATEATFFNNGVPGLTTPQITNFFDYSKTDRRKTFIHQSGSVQTTMIAGVQWQNTSAITSIEVYTPVGNFTAGSTISLFGIVG
jgi:hypothetical protein